MNIFDPQTVKIQIHYSYFLISQSEPPPLSSDKMDVKMIYH